MSKRVTSFLAALALLFGFGLAAAPAASAGGNAGYQQVSHSTDSLGGSIGYGRYNGTTGTLVVGTSTKSYNDGNDLVSKVRAGSGYCVWEEILRQVGGTSTWTKVADSNYGKSVSTQWFTIKSLSLAFGTPGDNYISRLHIYAC